MLRVLRLCSVFEPRELSPAWVAYDPIGGMQNHAAELTRCLDRLGVAQLVVTSRLADDALWAEVLNMGGYDVLAVPLDSEEVMRVIGAALRHVDNEQQRCKPVTAPMVLVAAS